MDDLENIVSRARQLWPIWLIYLVLVVLVLLGVFFENSEGLLIAHWFIFFLAPFTLLYCIPFGMGVGILAQARVWYLPKHGHRFILVCTGLMAFAMGIAWMPSIVLNYDIIYVMAFVWPILCSALMMRIGMYFVRQSEYEESMREIESGIYDYDETEDYGEEQSQEHVSEQDAVSATLQQEPEQMLPAEMQSDEQVGREEIPADDYPATGDDHAVRDYPVGDDSKTVQLNVLDMSSHYPQTYDSDNFMSPTETAQPDLAVPGFEENVRGPVETAGGLGPVETAGVPAPPQHLPTNTARAEVPTAAPRTPTIIYASDLRPAPLSPGPEAEPVPSDEEAGLIFIVPSEYL